MLKAITIVVCSDFNYFHIESFLAGISNRVLIIETCFNEFFLSFNAIQQADILVSVNLLSMMKYFDFFVFHHCFILTIGYSHQFYDSLLQGR